MIVTCPCGGGPESDCPFRSEWKKEGKMIHQSAKRSFLSLVFLPILLAAQTALADHCDSHPAGQEVLTIREEERFAPVLHRVHGGGWMKLPVFRIGKVLSCASDDAIQVEWAKEAVAFNPFRSVRDNMMEVLAERDLWVQTIRAHELSPGVKVSASLEDYGDYQDFSIGTIDRVYRNKNRNAKDGDSLVALVKLTLLDGERAKVAPSAIQPRAFLHSQIERIGQKIALEWSHPFFMDAHYDDYGMSKSDHD